MVDLNRIKRELREAIKQSGLTQKQIADYLYVGQQTISKYVNGKFLPALDTFANLCTLLDLDANEILCIGEYKIP